MRRSNPTDGLLPNDVLGRIALGLLSAVFLPVAGVCLFGLTLAPPPSGFGLWLIRVALWEFFAALLCASACGLLWSIVAPNWLPRYAHRFARHLSLLALVPFLILLGWYFWPL